VAWTTVEAVPDGRPVAIDLGQRPRFVDTTTPHAAVWVLRGEQADIAKARRFIEAEHPDTGRVLVYPDGEPNPLGRARTDVLGGRL
jgi:hypothetical protein